MLDLYSLSVRSLVNHLLIYIGGGITVLPTVDDRDSYLPSLRAPPVSVRLGVALLEFLLLVIPSGWQEVDYIYYIY